MKKIALVDLDGVLNEYNGVYKENEIPCIKPGAKEFLENLAKCYDIEIFTVRNKLETAKWLQKNEIEHLIKDISNVKNQYASVIIDDRAIGFKGNYSSLLEESLNFRPYWQKK